MDSRASTPAGKASTSLEKVQISGQSSGQSSGPNVNVSQGVNVGQVGKRLRDGKGAGNVGASRRAAGNVPGAVYNTETLKEKQVRYYIDFFYQ